ncbi:Eco57I restriction-modification methylase domain-containing protein [Clostridium butyricum]|uniref:Eco57I restriction-modification methylase domain-containing protein n=1 Tax=Clostridium butyricum TaxID=1492 RepID=UPI0034662A62
MKENEFKNAFEYKVVYAFTIDDELHKGMIKIGDATLHTESMVDTLVPNCKELNQAVLKRIKSYTNTAGITTKLLHTELAIRTIKTEDGMKLKAFRDHDIHEILKNSGIENVVVGNTTGREWFKIDLETVKKAIEAVKHNVANLSNSEVVKFTPIIFRPEQEQAIEKTVKQFKKSDKMLWNAKMRFGKTVCALEVVKQCKFQKTIIITHRPVVNVGWYDDFKKIFHGNNDYVYSSKTNGYTVKQLLELKKNFVYFASVQDLRGSSAVGGKFDKNDIVFQTNWDCVIVDEAHEGTTTALGEDTVKAIVKDGLGTKFLALSGTPFNILSEYDEDSIYTWDYIMEQECKSEWDKLHFGDSNPYDELPELRIYTYDLGDVLVNNEYITFEDKAFNFHEFFRTWTGDFKYDYANMPESAVEGDFVHEDDVKSFLNLMTKTDDKSCYPYSNEKYRNLFKHSLWMVPGVKEARALKKLMLKHPIFGNGMFDIVNVAGNGDEEEKSEEALTKVKKAIKDAGDDNYTITLSCGKLTTGVTVKEWTAVFMLSGSYSTSAANYLQTIFRVQSPCNDNGKIKKTSYVFDFAPDRTLKMVSSAVSVSSKVGKTKSGDKQIIGKFLNYCPVIAVSGSEMHEYSAHKLLQQLKKAYADKVVRNGFDDTNLYNDELFKLQEVDIKKFDELKGIIGTSKAAPKQKDITVNGQGLTKEEYEEGEKLKKKPKKDLTLEEKGKLEELKKLKKLRNDAISILRGISIRMPLLIYGAEIPYNEGITLEKFVEVVDDSSWNEFMPSGITKKKFKEFEKYYDEEVFIEAGRRIRNIAREADTLDPTERVKKITSLFSNFKNPDKETVLTPWKVVNMHICNCLGGYNFFDENYRDLLDKPQYIDNGQVTRDTLSNTNAKILEINSKTGLYPLYVTYSIFREQCKKYSDDELTIELQKKLWNDTVEKNVFVICKTPMAKQITQRTLMGYSNFKINAHYFDDLINVMKNKPQQFIDKVVKPNYWKLKGDENVKFDAIVGNPPYQESTENTSDKPIYHLFMESAFKISDKVSFITPARFLFNAGKTPKDWNEKILNDEHFKVIWYKANSTEVFPNVDIKGGVAVTFRDTKNVFGKIGIYSPMIELNSILKKVESKMGKSLSEVVYSPESYKFSNKLHIDNKWVVERLSKGHSRDITSNIFEKLPELFLDEQKSDKYVGIYGRINNNRELKWIKREYIEKHDNLDCYKVFIPKSNGTGSFGEALSTPIIGSPTIGHTQTFISIGAFETNYEANALLKYIKSKFSRCMLGVLKVTQDNKKSVWRFVPQQDFTSKSDIDWTNSIKEIDKQLYAKYALTEEEIAFIEEKIKPME